MHIVVSMHGALISQAFDSFGMILRSPAFVWYGVTSGTSDPYLVVQVFGMFLGVAILAWYFLAICSWEDPCF